MARRDRLLVWLDARGAARNRLSRRRLRCLAFALRDGDRHCGRSAEGEQPCRCAEWRPPTRRPPRGGRRRRGSSGGERRVVSQDRALELAQGWAGLEPKLVVEDAAGLAVGLECLGLAAASVEGEDQACAQALAERIAPYKSGEL